MYIQRSIPRIFFPSGIQNLVLLLVLLSTLPLYDTRGGKKKTVILNIYLMGHHSFPDHTLMIL